MGKFSFSNFFGTDEETIHEDERQQSADSDKSTPINASNKVISMKKQSRVTQSSIAVFEPLVYSDVKAIAAKLIDNSAVIVNFYRSDNTSIKRIIDFLNGTVFTIDGSIERISEKVFLFTPHNFAVDADVKGNLSHRFK